MVWASSNSMLYSTAKLCCGLPHNLGRERWIGDNEVGSLCVSMGETFSRNIYPVFLLFLTHKVMTVVTSIISSTENLL
jgi:hypothetical protein